MAGQQHGQRAAAFQRGHLGDDLLQGHVVAVIAIEACRQVGPARDVVGLRQDFEFESRLHTVPPALRCRIVDLLEREGGSGLAAQGCLASFLCRHFALIISVPNRPHNVIPLPQALEQHRAEAHQVAPSSMATSKSLLMPIDRWSR